MAEAEGERGKREDGRRRWKKEREREEEGQDER